MTNREDAVSGAIGGVLLIALVLIGAAIVGTYVASQPPPEKIPKVQFGVKEFQKNIFLEHEGGESLVDDGSFSVVVDGQPIGDDKWEIVSDEPGDDSWNLGDRIKIDEEYEGAESIGLVYNSGSGSTLLRVPRSTGGFGYVFPAPDPFEVVDVPDLSYPPAGEFGDLDWNFKAVDVPPPNYAPGEYSDMTWQFPSTGEPQALFPPVNTKHVYVAASNSKMTPPGDQLFPCDGIDDEREINAAIAMAEGGVVELLDGDFRCHGRITLRPDTTLKGQGSQGSLRTTVEITGKEGETGYLPIYIGAENVNVMGFTMRGDGFVMVTRSNVRVHDIRATCVDLAGHWHTALEHKIGNDYRTGNGMFFVWVAPPVDVINNVEFYECHAVDCHTHGFNMNQDYSDGVARATTNIRFLNCRAVRCGYGVPAGSKSEWTTGFDFHEWQDLINLEVVNCIASDNWESGFHLEPGARYGDNGENIGPRTVSRNVYFRSCVSAGNGMRNTHASRFFMSGYYLSRDTHLYNCQSLVNRNAGYYVHGGQDSSFTDCTDEGSLYGWKICKASSEITLTDCKSSNNPRWALWLSFSRGIHVDNFEQRNVAGDRGYQSILGWYKDEAKYQQPVTNSDFDITAYGSGVPIINKAGSGNTYDLSYGAIG